MGVALGQQRKMEMAMAIAMQHQMAVAMQQQTTTGVSKPEQLFLGDDWFKNDPDFASTLVRSEDDDHPGSRAQRCSM